MHVTKFGVELHDIAKVNGTIHLHDTEGVVRPLSDLANYKFSIKGMHHSCELASLDGHETNNITIKATADDLGAHADVGEEGDGASSTSGLGLSTVLSV